MEALDDYTGGITLDECILDLPDALLHKVLSLLDAKSIAMWSRTSRRCRELAVNDVIWKLPCLRLGFSDPAACNLDSFYGMYSKFLHAYGDLLGYWEGDTAPFGSILCVHRSGSHILGSMLTTTTLNGPVFVRTVFILHVHRGGTNQMVLCARSVNAHQRQCSATCVTTCRCSTECTMSSSKHAPSKSNRIQLFVQSHDPDIRNIDNSMKWQAVCLYPNVHRRTHTKRACCNGTSLHEQSS